MAGDDRALARPEGGPLSDSTVLRDQRDANEKPVVAAIRARRAAERDAWELRVSTGS